MYRSIVVDIPRTTLALAVLAAAAPARQTPLTEFLGAAGDIAGWAVEAAGDIDADGFPDLLVGAPRAITTGGTNDGVAWIASGRFLATGVGPTRIHTWDGNPNQTLTASRFGHTLAGGRDVDLDGVPDVVIGSPNDDSGGISGGSVSIFSGATGIRIGFEVASHYQILGTSVAFAGDVNGDGWVDVIGGAPVSDTTFGVAYAHVHVYSGEWMARTAAGLTPTTPAELHDIVGLYNHDDFGAAVAPIGDLDGDGLDDFAVGGKRVGSANGGYVAIYRGGTTVPFMVAHGTTIHDQFGSALADVGDLDGDGLHELAVGAWADDVGPANSLEGSVTVLRGAWLLATGLGSPFPGPRELWQRSGTAASSFYGSWVTAVGDLDGDGVSEVAVGAPQGGNSTPTGNGYVEVMSGRTGTLLFRSSGATFSGQFGRGIAGPGDIDGDGRSDVAIGAPYDGQGGTSAGSIVVLRGFPNVGTPICAANATANSSGSVARLVTRGSTSQAIGALLLELSGAPSARPALFFRGTTTTLAPFGNGVRCAGGQIARLGARFTEPNGTAVHPFDIGASTVGSTLVFQAWLEDAFAGGALFNTSDAVSIVVTP